MNVNVYDGVNRLFYKATGFAEGKEITAVLWNPSLVKSGPHNLTELEGGLYYMDFDFNRKGIWAGLFYENGVVKAPATVRVGMDILPLVRVIGSLN